VVFGVGRRDRRRAIQAKSVAAQIKDTQWLLDRHLSFCFYMFDGGRILGFRTGRRGGSRCRLLMTMMRRLMNWAGDAKIYGTSGFVYQEFED